MRKYLILTVRTKYNFHFLITKPNSESQTVIADPRAQSFWNLITHYKKWDKRNQNNITTFHRKKQKKQQQQQHNNPMSPCIT